MAYDPVVAAGSSWLDPTGGTQYDRVLVRLHSVSVMEHTAKTLQVIVRLVGGRCGHASITSFRSSAVADDTFTFRMGGLLAFKRGEMAPTDVELTVGPSPRVVEAAGPNEKAVDPGKGAFVVSCAVPRTSSQTYTDHRIIGPNAIVRVSVRLEKWESPILTAEGLATLELQRVVFRKLPVADSPAEPAGKAVLSYKMRPGNKMMIYWLPGRNDLVMHYHAIEAFLEAGYDVFALEHRRLGRSNAGCSAEDMALVSHCRDMRVYIHEFDLGLKNALSRKDYSRCVLYAHSTGGLEATMWLRERGAALPFSAVVLNSPSLYETAGLVGSRLRRLMTRFDVICCCSTASWPWRDTEPDSYHATTWMQYPAIDCTLRNVIGGGVKATLGWVHSVRVQQEALANANEPCTTAPTYVLTTPGDTVLDLSEIKERVSPAAVLEAIPYCRHDMLLNYEKAQNDEVIQKIVGWLAATHWATIHAAPTSPPTNMPHARQPIFDLPFPTMPDPISMAL